MAIITIDKFGGEIPRKTKRDLPAGSAQVAQNLLATSSDFHPVTSAEGVSSTTNFTAATLYRRQRNAVGDILTNIDSGWETFAGQVSAVRGQVADDTTERTYYTYDDGSSPPFKMDGSTGATSRPMGIPRPAKPTISVLKATKLTRAAAQTWRDMHFNVAVYNAVMESLSLDQVASRFTATAYDLTSNNRGCTAATTMAGITHLIPQDTGQFQLFPRMSGSNTNSQRGVFEPWNMMIRVNKTDACQEGLLNPQLNGIEVGDGVWLGFMALPLWGVLNKVALRNKLSLLFGPNGEALFIGSQLDYLVESIGYIVSTENFAEVTLKRSMLDAAYLDYCKNGEKLVANHVKPVAASFDTDALFQSALEAWKNLQSSAVTAMVSASTRAVKLVEEIEAAYTAIHDDLQNILTTWLNNIHLEKTDADMNGLVVIDNDPIIDVRFYVNTFVTDWDEESAPSEPSSRIEVDWNDLVVVDEPVVPSGYNHITKWRQYRTNSGVSSTALQFVSEQAITSTPPESDEDHNAITGYVVAGYGDRLKWRDIVATWTIYTKRNRSLNGAVPDVFADTKDLRIGDTVTQTSPWYDEPTQTFPKNDYKVKKTWNGSAWVMQPVPSLSSVMGRRCYVDGKYGSLLGEVCPTITWAPPPYRMTVTDPLPITPATKGTNPYLRGLTNMPNGIMAGFVDNFVAFCEPYVPYAWPVAYQVPLDFPIVGLCAFGQSLLVGTRANPYIVSGTDSSSMSGRKLSEPQACVSAKSMVPVAGGVAYASPDGYCLANEVSVEVITLGLFSKTDWQKLNPSSIFAVVHDSVLYFWYTGNGGGCYGLDLVAKKLIRVGYIPPPRIKGPLTEDTITAVFEDVVTDAVYAVRNGSIVRLFDGGYVYGKWRSGKVTLPSQSPFAWIRVISDFDDNQASVYVNLYANGSSTAFFSGEFQNIEPRRLPPGRPLEIEIEILANCRVSSVTIASTTEELKSS